MLIYIAENKALSYKSASKAIKTAVPQAETVCFDSPSELYSASEARLPDIVFLNTDIPGTDSAELARNLQGLKPDINIIFISSQKTYAYEAMELFASGYLLTPVEAEQIKNQMEHLRHPIRKNRSVKIKTFGNFAVFKDGNAVNIRYSKSKELLAYLVDRKGALITRKEICAVLLEDGTYSRNEQKLLSRWVRELEADLAQYGISRIFSREAKGYRVLPESFECDLYDYLDGLAPNAYHGEYMEEYEFGETFKALHCTY